MIKVSCDINEIIDFLQKKKEEGYQKVEIIDESRANGWILPNPTINFIFNDAEPNVVGIDIRNRR